MAFRRNFQTQQQENTENGREKVERSMVIKISKSWIYGWYSDKGMQKERNEDSFLLQHIETKKGEILLAGICDGMGGLFQGEIASGYVCEEVGKWFYKELLPILWKNRMTPMQRTRVIKKSGCRLFSRINEELVSYQTRKHKKVGTTASILICYQRRYYVFHIGDSRIIIFHKSIEQITKEHAVNANTLTRCLGVNGESKPDFMSGRIRKKMGFLLCSDGFIQKVKAQDMGAALQESTVRTTAMIQKILKEIAVRSMQRGETDNLSAIYLERKKEKFGIKSTK